MLIKQEFVDAQDLVKQVLGPRLVEQIGCPRHTLGDALGYLAYASKRLFPGKIKPQRSNLDDGLVLVYGSWRIRRTGGFTLGRYIFPRIAPPDRLFIIHEYVHVLQWRAEGLLFLWHYIRQGLWNWPPRDADGWPVVNARYNSFETQAIEVEAIYRKTPGLPDPWQLGSCSTDLARQTKQNLL
ncbi:MAG: hypothetical protein ACYC6L_00705 [Anaerolineae bacterium]